MRGKAHGVVGRLLACLPWRAQCCGLVGILVFAWNFNGTTAQTLKKADQSLHIHSGWNAVYLRVHAPLNERVALLEGAAVSRILMRSADDRSHTESIENVLQSQNWPDAGIWVGREVGRDDSDAIRSAAKALVAGRCYLVKAEREAQDVGLAGPPAVGIQDWRGLAGTLFAAPGDPDNEITIEDYFRHSPVHGNAEFFTLLPDGTWQPVAQPESTPLEADRCLFVKVPGASNYQGPLEAGVEGDGLVFASDATEQYLRLVNRTSESAVITLSTPSFPVANETNVYPSLFAWRYDRAARIATQELSETEPQDSEITTPWSEINESGTEIHIPPGGSSFVRLGANIAAALDWRGRSATNAESTVHSVLSVHGVGVRYELPITIDLGPPMSPEEQGAALTGLWVGEVAVGAVSFAVSEDLGPLPVPEPLPLLPVSEPFRFRLIVHRGADGTCSILSDAIEMQNADGAQRHLLTDEEEARDQASGGATVLSRVRSVAYVTDGAVSAQAPTVAAGAPGCLARGSTFSFDLSLEYDHPLNPDLHGAHPDHDNLDDRYEKKLPAGAEAATIKRVLTLSVADSLSLEEYSPDRSTARVTGAFDEEISGIHKDVLKTKGRFLLRRVSDVSRIGGE